MKDPDRRLADLPAGGRIRIGRRFRDARGEASAARKAHAAADRSERRESPGVLASEAPRPVAPHREPREIDARRIPVELPDRLVERGNGLRLHLGKGPPLLLPALRQDDDGRNALRMPPDCAADPDLGLDQPVVAALPGAMQEEDHRPLLALAPLGRDVDLIAVRRAAEPHGPVQEPGFALAREGGRGQRQERDRDQRQVSRGKHRRSSSVTGCRET